MILGSKWILFQYWHVNFDCSVKGMYTRFLHSKVNCIFPFVIGHLIVRKYYHLKLDRTLQ